MSDAIKRLAMKLAQTRQGAASRPPVSITNAVVEEVAKKLAVERMEPKVLANCKCVSSRTQEIGQRFIGGGYVESISRCFDCGKNIIKTLRVR